MKKFLTIALLMLTTGIAAQELQLTETEQIVPDSVSAPIIENDPSVSSNTCPYLDRIKGQYYLDGGPVNRKEVRKFLENNSPLLVLPSMFSGDYSEMRNVGPALGIMLGGGLLIAGSVPCMTVGIIYKTRAHEIYNRNCAKQPQIELSLQTSTNGLGLALKF